MLDVLNAKRHVLVLAKQKLSLPQRRSWTEHELDRIDAEIFSAQTDQAQAQIAQLFSYRNAPVFVESAEVKQKLSDARSHLRTLRSQFKNIESILVAVS